MGKPVCVNVELGARSYPIFIGKGVLANAGEMVNTYAKSHRVAVITDETVANLHLETLRKGLAGYGFELDTIRLPAGEATKSFDHLQQILTTLLEREYARSDTLIAFGGGVIGDLTGFAASVLKRGCQFVQIPTTLLAQVDSSVGGKTAINVKAGKNLVGSFYQPRLVLADTDVLKTLDQRQIRAGYAEVLKYGLIDRADFFDWLEGNVQNIFAQNAGALAHIIATSCQAKADIVAKDEREHGMRALLNLGHTFGHALEGIGGYDGRILHGEAVSAGMLMAFEFSNFLGICPAQDVDRLSRHLQGNNLPRFQELCERITVRADEMLDFMVKDKKNANGAFNLILTRGIGKAFVAKDVPRQDLHTYLTKALFGEKTSC